MSDFALIRLDERYRKRVDLPDAYLPIPLPMAAGTMPADALLRALQEHAAASLVWQTFEPLWERLAEQLGQGELQVSEVELGSPGWCLCLGPVDLSGPIVTLQRGEHLIAAVAEGPGSSLIVAAYRPLDSRALRFLTGLALRPAPDGTVAMRLNNWEYALDQASYGTAQAYAAADGLTYLSLWQFGLGIVADGTQEEGWLQQRGLLARPPDHVAAELRAFERWPEPPKLRLSLASAAPDEADLRAKPMRPV